MEQPHYAVLFEPVVGFGTNRGAFISPDWSEVARQVDGATTRYQIHYFQSQPEAQQRYLAWLSKPQDGGRSANPPFSPSFSSPGYGGGVGGGGRHAHYNQGSGGGGGGGGGRGGGGERGNHSVSSPLAFDDECGSPAALPQGIQKTWLDVKMAKLCPGKELDSLQRRAVEEVMVHRSNVFLTGSGGVGKSFLSGLIIDLLKEHFGFDYDKKVCVAASTGIASTHINGTTLHTATGPFLDHFGRMFNHDKKVDQFWSKHYEVLLVDEISMLSGEMLDALDDIIQQVRKNKSPFGGLQVIMVGDFAQLPPVPEDPSYTTHEFVPRDHWRFPRHKEFWHMPVVAVRERKGNSGRNAVNAKQEVLFSNRGLALQSDVWWNMDLHIIELTRVFRQDDEAFISVLNRMRIGAMDRTDMEWMNHQFYTRPLQQENEEQQNQYATGAASRSQDQRLHLYPKNALVERRNKFMMERIQHPEESFPAHDFVFVYQEDGSAIVQRNESAEAYAGDKLRLAADLKLLLNNNIYYRSCLAAESVGLKLGAKVLLLKNLDLQDKHKLVNGSVGKVVAWADKDHQFLDEIVDEKTGEKIRDVQSEKGAAVVEEEGSNKQSERERDLLAYKERKVRDWYRDNADRIPVVLFTNGRRKAIAPELFSENIVGVGSTCRLQVPLMIAFAISIHKSQGMTLQEAVVDVQECFEGGQSYVAMSRVGPREGLRLANPLQAKSIMVNPTFLLWKRLRCAMEQRRATLLALLLAQNRPVEHDRVERLGLKGLHDDAVQFLNSAERKKDASLELKKAYAALKSSLDCLKPVRDETKKETRIVHWQMLDWWKWNNREKMESIYKNKKPRLEEE